MARTSKNGRLRVEWPVGPAVDDLDPRKGVYGWVNFKLESADWYLDRLEEVLNVAARFQHPLGAEMALDGVLGSLCSAVDAACAGVIEAAEMRRPPKGKATPSHRYSPNLAILRLREHGRKRTPTRLEQARDVDDQAVPVGWLAQLSRLRNKVVHQTALSRTHFVGGPHDGEVHIDVPGLGPRDALSYLRGARERVGRLCEQLLSEVAWLAPGSAIGQSSLGVNVQVQAAIAAGSAFNATVVVS